MSDNQTQTQETLNLLAKKHRIYLSIDSETSHMAFPDFNYKGFVDDIVKGMKPYFDEMGGWDEEDKLMIGHKEHHISFSIRNNTDFKLFFSIPFTNGKPELSILSFELKNKDLRGKGIPQNFFKAFIKHLYPQGCSEIDLVMPVQEAIYSWTKYYGALPDKNGWNELKGHIAMNALIMKLSKEDTIIVDNIIGSDDPKSLRDIVNLESKTSYKPYPSLGFGLTYGLTLGGMTFDLDDQSTRTILENRLGTTVYDLTGRPSSMLDQKAVQDFEVLEKKHHAMLSINKEMIQFAIPGFDYLAFTSDIVKAVTPYFDYLETWEKKDRLKLMGQPNNIIFALPKNNGNLDLEFVIGFDGKKPSVMISGFETINPELRGKGIPQGLYKTFIKHLHPQGMRDIHLFMPLDEAVYGWSKYYGFLPNQESWDNIKEQIKRNCFRNGLPQSDRERINKILKSDDPRAIREIVALDDKNQKFSIRGYSHTLGYAATYPLILESAVKDSFNDFVAVTSEGATLHFVPEKNIVTANSQNKTFSLDLNDAALKLDLNDKESCDILERRLGVTIHELVARDRISTNATQPNVAIFREINPNTKSPTKDGEITRKAGNVK